MGVSRRSFVVFIALLVGLALAAPTFAKEASMSFTLSHMAKVAGTTLQPGDYQVVLDETKATFKQRGKVVAEANGQWKPNHGKDAVGALVRDEEGRILEIHIQGRDTFFALS